MEKSDSKKLIEVFSELGIQWSHSGAAHIEGDPDPPESYLAISTSGCEFIFDEKGNYLGSIDVRNNWNNKIECKKEKY